VELRAGTQTQLRQSGSDLFVDHVFVPEVVFGSATLLDAQGNPTPDPAVHDPAAFNPDTILIATTYPAPTDNGTGQVTTFHGGDMHFRRTGGAGAEAWELVAGSFRASNANGNYQRDADGTQRCWNTTAVSLTTGTVWGNIYISSIATWTYPAVFAATPSVQPGAEWGGGTGSVAWLVPQAITASDGKYYLASAVSGGSAAGRMEAIGKWAA
jgi:hypothetical protein